MKKFLPLMFATAYIITNTSASEAAAKDKWKDFDPDSYEGRLVCNVQDNQQALNAAIVNARVAVVDMLKSPMNIPALSMDKRLQYAEVSAKAGLITQGEGYNIMTTGRSDISAVDIEEAKIRRLEAATKLLEFDKLYEPFILAMLEEGLAPCPEK